MASTSSTTTTTTTPSSPYSITNPFRTAILSHQIVTTLTIKFLTGIEIAILASQCGIPALFVDMEHSPLDLHSVSQLILACHSVNVSPLVRSPSKSAWHISRLLDAGAHAVIVPHVESVAECRELVRCAKYAPLGTRGCTNNMAIFGYQHVPTRVLQETLNRETWLIPMIETPTAVELVEEFLKVEGVDGLLVGSNDLCTDLGIPGQYDSRVYQDAVDKIVLAGKKAGKPIGIGGIGTRPDLLERWFEMGASWCLSATDMGLLQQGLRKMRKDYGEMNERVQKARMD